MMLFRRLLVGFLLFGSLLVSSAWSAVLTQPSIVKYSDGVKLWDSVGELCTAGCAAIGSACKSITVESSDPPSCGILFESGYSAGYWKPLKVYKCLDASWTLSADEKTCTKEAPTCPSGQVVDEATGECKSSSCSVPENQTLPGVYSVPWPPIPGSQYCINGCRVFGPSGNTITGGGRRSGTFTSYGQPCVGSSSAIDPGSVLPDSPAAKCIEKGLAFGTVNGVVVCTDPTEKTNTSTESKTSTDPTKNSTTNITTTTSCSGEGSCTTTTTTTTTSGGSGPGGTGPGSTTTPPETTTTEDSKDGFCEKNPNSSFCKSPDDPCLEHPDRIECTDKGTAPSEEGLSTEDKNIVSAIIPLNIASNATCPADVQLGKGVYLTYAGICQYAEGLRPIVLASAWLIAEIIALSMAKL